MVGHDEAPSERQLRAELLRESVLEGWDLTDDDLEAAVEAFRAEVAARV